VGFEFSFETAAAAVAVVADAAGVDFFKVDGVLLFPAVVLPVVVVLVLLVLGFALPPPPTVVVAGVNAVESFVFSKAAFKELIRPLVDDRPLTHWAVDAVVVVVVVDGAVAVVVVALLLDAE